MNSTRSCAFELSYEHADGHPVGTQFRLLEFELSTRCRKIDRVSHDFPTNKRSAEFSLVALA